MSLIPQLGFFEIMLLAVLALVVVGPKDLPRLMRGIGQFVAQARNMAREFMSSFDQMAREAELKELQQEIESLKKANPINEIRDEVNKTMAPLKDPGTFDPEAKADPRPESAEPGETRETGPAPADTGDKR